MPQNDEVISEMWKRLRKKIDCMNLPGLVHDIIADCDCIELWQVETILPILSNHVLILDRRMESDKKEKMKKKVEEEQHFFWQIAREKKARPPLFSKRIRILSQIPGIFWITSISSGDPFTTHLLCLMSLNSGTASELR